MNASYTTWMIHETINHLAATVYVGSGLVLLLLVLSGVHVVAGIFFSFPSLKRT